MTADLIGPLLRNVSRSFYLTLRVLPPEIRPQISLTYLLARASDTIADTKAVPTHERIEMLRRFAVGEEFKLTPADCSAGEQRLLVRLEECLAMLASLPEQDQRLIRELHQTIITGQIFDLERFPDGTHTALTAAELDRYTYLVAGCVGEFWTKICRAHLPGLEALSEENGRSEERRV